MLLCQVLFIEGFNKYFCLKVFSSILHQYRELYLNNHGNIPAELPSIEDQLTYIYKYLKRSIKQLEIHKTYNADKMTIKEYVIKATGK